MGKAKSAAKTVANAAGTAYNAATSGPFKLLKAGAGKLFGAAKGVLKLGASAALVYGGVKLGAHFVNKIQEKWSGVSVDSHIINEPGSKGWHLSFDKKVVHTEDDLSAQAGAGSASGTQTTGTQTTQTTADGSQTPSTGGTTEVPATEAPATEAPSKYSIDLEKAGLNVNTGGTENTVDGDTPDAT